MAAAKTILVYGDSLTWGYEPGTGRRYAPEDQWPSVLEAGLGHQVKVYAEGVCGRTTVYDDDAEIVDLNGASTLPVALRAHEPLDLVIIMLGTNDHLFGLRDRAALSAEGMSTLARLVMGFAYRDTTRTPQVLLVAPPPLVNAPENVQQQSNLFAATYAKAAAALGVHFFDAGTVAAASPLDGCHLDVRNTRAIGAALVPVVKAILER